ncbi:hypothetical protein HHK36_016746 [Tetracentron sinense]|uniref:phosphopyruvate hydratase n=1 Tax=Tetracentron sinense TaxID=13715 RepID=A0A834Z5U8_TETSI|nr:hypothetical protein HHK36_016746 [Tetracentron sinense]
MATIQSVKARQIFDSRGNPTVEVDIILSDGTLSRAAVPSGASTGIYEALELRDGGSDYLGKGVLKAVGNGNTIIGPALIGKDPTEQVSIDNYMVQQLDGTVNEWGWCKQKLGANAILAVSLAVCKAGASAKKIPLYKEVPNATFNFSTYLICGGSPRSTLRPKDRRYWNARFVFPLEDHCCNEDALLWSSNRLCGRYLRPPNNDDIARLLAVAENRGFPRMLGSIDYMHWKWKNCPTAWKRMYSGHVLNYSINGNDYEMDYYLADGIYPQWSTFVKTILSPQGNKHKYFAAAQESAKNDVEREFGVLQTRFANVCGPTRFWKYETLKNIMKACIIIFNMIVEDTQDVNGAEDFNYDAINESPHALVSHEHTIELMEYIRGTYKLVIRDRISTLPTFLVTRPWCCQFLLSMSSMEDHMQEINSQCRQCLITKSIFLPFCGRHSTLIFKFRIGLCLQEFMILPVGASSFKEAMKMGVEVYHHLKAVIKKKYGQDATNVGDEGGFAPNIQENKEGLELLKTAIAKAGYTEQVVIGMDVAASEFYGTDKTYDLNFKEENNDGSQKISGDALKDVYKSFVADYPIVSIEDPFDQDDWKHYTKITSEIGKEVQIVGDDLLVTNPKRVEKAIKEKACNALLLKVNQIGSVTESIEAVKMSKRAGWGVMASHRSGETEDTFIADLSVGLATGQIKTGAPCRSERLAKYNQLLRIEEELGSEAIYAGAKFRKPVEPY